MDAQEIAAAEELLGYAFRDKVLLQQSLTHASIAPSRLASNERLEFLGDMILGMVVCEYLFLRYDDLLEGDLTKIKSSVVSRRTCADVALESNLEDLLLLGKGMDAQRSLPRSIVAAVYEALVGAIYLDGGLEVARNFVLAGMKKHIENAARSGHQYNFKSVLQQEVQQRFSSTPQYVVLDEQGPDHAKCFEVCVEIGARRFSSTWGASKKQAEQQAALEALIELGVLERGDDGDIRSPGCESANIDDVVVAEEAEEEVAEDLA
jgi:ribonuclease-3